MSARVDWISHPAGPLRGEIRVPGDKSISHRAVMLAALAEGTSRIDGFLEGEDTRATAAILARLGVDIDASSPSSRVVHGVGMHGLRASAETLDCGNSGTAMRLLAGLLAGQSFDSVLSGDASLLRRPMRRVLEPLTAMGACIDGNDGGLPPLRITAAEKLCGARFTPTMASAQVKSAILLAGLYAEGETQVREPRATRDHTERLLAAFGWPVHNEGNGITISGGHGLCATHVEVPGDISSAAFLIVAASIVPGSELTLRNVGVNPRRIGLLRVLRAMGADISEDNLRESSGEPVADLTIRHAPLHGIEVPDDAVADMIDEFPVLFVAAAAASGTTRFRRAAELRVKESDRIAVMSQGLRALGVPVEEFADGADIAGHALHAGTVDSAGDHRCAMSFAIAGLIADGPVTIGDCANVATSFPGFLEIAAECGFDTQDSGIGAGV